MTGIVASFNDTRGYGFITPLVGRPNDVENIFFHVSAVKREGRERPTIPKGAEVRFCVVRGNKGLQAASVELVKVKL